LNDTGGIYCINTLHVDDDKDADSVVSVVVSLDLMETKK